jgi:hypothetical protein
MPSREILAHTFVTGLVSRHGVGHAAGRINVFFDVKSIGLLGRRHGKG